MASRDRSPRPLATVSGDETSRKVPFSTTDESYGQATMPDTHVHPTSIVRDDDLDVTTRCCQD